MNLQHTFPHLVTEFLAPLLQAPLPSRNSTCLPFGWWDSVYRQFSCLALHFGLTVDQNRTCFSGFYHEGSGCSYAAEIDVKQLLACLKEQCGQAAIFKGAINLPEIITDPNVIDLLERGIIGATGHVRPLKHKTRIYVAMEFKHPWETQNCRAIDQEIELFIDTVIALCDELNEWLFARLLYTYEHLVNGEIP